MLTLGFSRGRLPRGYFVTAPINYYNRFTGQETWPDPLTLSGANVLGAGTTIGGIAVGANAPIVAITTLSVTAALHAGKTILLSLLAGFTSTLPAATGTGNIYKFIIGIVNTSASYIINTAGSDVFKGSIMITVPGSTYATANIGETFASTAGTHLTLNGTATGGATIGDWVEVQDIASAVWAVRGNVTGTTTPLTMFS